MKYLYILSLLITAMVFQSCGKTRVFQITNPTVEVEVPVVVEVPQKLEGLYAMEEVSTGEISGPIEIIVHFDGSVEVSQASNNHKLRSQNFNGTFGTHPLIRFSGAQSSDDYSFTSSLDVNYSSSDDLEEDGTNSDLGSGRHFTVYEFSLDEDDKLNLTIKIHEGSLSSSGGINDVVIERVFKEVE